MRIHRVDLTGFGPYKDTESVDLDEFIDDGVFLITGRTGAGKSCILDAITFALFGSIPRYGGTGTSPGERVRSDHIGPDDPCEVSVEFTVDGQRYKVTRSPEYMRPKRRGDGLTLQKSTAEFARRGADGWEVIESQVRNVGIAVSDVVGLSAPQFLQVILLAQGQFQEFLVADSDSRRTLLRSLFHTGRFDDYAERLHEMASALRTELQGSTSTIAAHLHTVARICQGEVPDTVDAETGSGVEEWIEPLLAEHAATVQRSAAVAAEAKKALTTAQRALTTAQTTAERQHRLSKAQRQHAELDAEAAEIAELRTRVAAGRRAAEVHPYLTHADAARARAATTSARRAESLAAYLAGAGELPAAQEDESNDAPVAALTDAVESIDQLLGSLAGHVTTEQNLPGLAAAVKQADADLEAFDVEAEDLRAKRETLRDRLTEFATTIATLEDEAAPKAELDAAVADASRRLQQSTRADATEQQVVTALAASTQAGHTVSAASDARNALRVRQLSEYAATLAVDLTPGHACPVCGSTEHPAPSEPSDDHVTDNDLAAAEERYEAALAGSREADETHARLAEQLRTAREAAGGLSTEELTEQVNALGNQAKAAADAESNLKKARGLQTTATEQVASLTEQIEKFGPRRENLIAQQRTSRHALDTAQKQLSAARGEYPTVAARIEQETTRRHLTRSLVRAIEDDHRAIEAVTETARDLDEALRRTEFETAADATAARLAPGDLRAWEQRVAAHDAGRTAVSTVLEDPDLQDLPDEPVDLAAPQTAFDEADVASTEAVAAQSRAQAAADSLTDTATTIRNSLSSAAEVRARFQLVHGLAQTARGLGSNELRMSLETFVLAAELEEIVASANVRLSVMTSGRYSFAHSDALAARNRQSGLDLTVTDAHTGDARTPLSLSGGEKFQASLALALGLAEVVTSRSGGVRLDTLFIDEGFGSLDAETLETTMVTLDSLREGGRTIGVISHVEAMKESIPAKVFVDIAPGGWSTIR